MQCMCVASRVQGCPSWAAHRPPRGECTATLCSWMSEGRCSAGIDRERVFLIQPLALPATVVWRSAPACKRSLGMHVPLPAASCPSTATFEMRMHHLQAACGRERHPQRHVAAEVLTIAWTDTAAPYFTAAGLAAGGVQCGCGGPTVMQCACAAARPSASMVQSGLVFKPCSNLQFVQIKFPTTVGCQSRGSREEAWRAAVYDNRK